MKRGYSIMKKQITNIILPIIICTLLAVIRPLVVKNEIVTVVDTVPHMVYSDVRIDRNGYVNV